MLPGRMLRAFLTLLLATLLWSPAQAQQETNHIKAELLLVESTDGGTRDTYALHFTPEPGWHGYWKNPGDAGYGMQLEWSIPAEWVGAPLYPVPQTLLIGGLMNHVYEHEYAVLVPVSAPVASALGDRGPVTLEAQWLACTDEICVPEKASLTAVDAIPEGADFNPSLDGWRAAIPPMIDSMANFELTEGNLRIGIPLPASMAIAAPHLFLADEELIDYAAPQEFWRDGDLLVIQLKLKRTSVIRPEGVSGILKLDDAGNGLTFAAAPGNVAVAGDRLSTGSAGDLPPLWSLVLAALAGGLLLNIMPCVFPILSLKAISLARAGESEAEARAEGVAYTAGVMLACLALGAVMLALRAAGSEIGWAFQLQEPGVVVALLVLATAITANFAGLFELPSLSFSGSGQKMGAFSTGLLAAFAATPCTGPFMAAAMGAALLLPAWQGMLLFAVLGLGIALPFLLLGWVPPLRRLLPRPGAWMNTFRKIMAVPMGLTALALLWLAWRLGGTGFAAISVGLVIVLVALLGFAGARQRSGLSAMPMMVAGLPALAIGAVLALPATFDPPTRSEEGTIVAQPFSEATLARARADGKPVFIWFTADWCLTCKVNEGIAIETEATRAAFERAGVVAIRGDWTRRDPAITRFLTAHGAAGVPLYLWYPAGGEAEQLPQVLTPDSLVDLVGS